jgi:hypothetical protein
LSYLSGKGENNVIAFSLGNMVVSSAIQDHGATPTRYFMLHAAVAMEAYDANEYDSAANNNMVEIEWRNYPHRLYASEWFHLWDNQPTDGRHALTWQGRFSTVVAPQTYNFYSTGDEILDDLNDGGVDLSAMESCIALFGRNSWCGQELLKGRVLSDALGGSTYGGWGINYQYAGYSLDTQTLSDELLRQIPFFDKSSPTPWLYDPNNPTAGSQFAATYRGKLLADMIPAISFATGRNSLNALGSTRNFDMNKLYETGWPSERVNDSQKQYRWLHGDYRYVAYCYVYTLFDKISKDLGGLNQ